MTDQNIPAAASSHSERTGPHRRKPWHRPRNVVILLILLIAAVIGWAVWEVLKVHHGEPAITRNFQAEHNAMIVAELGIDPVRAAEARRLLERLIELEMNLLYDYAGERAEQNLHRDWDDLVETSLNYRDVLIARDPLEECPMECSDLDRMRNDSDFIAAFAAFAASAPALEAERNDESFMNAVVHHIGSARLVTSIRLAMMRLAVLRGNADDIAEAIEQILALTHTLSISCYPIAHLLAYWCDDLTMHEIMYTLSENQIDESALRSVRDAIDKHAPARRDFLLAAMEADSRDLLQRKFTAAGYELPDEPQDGSGRSLGQSFRNRFRMPMRSALEVILDDSLETAKNELKMSHRNRVTASDLQMRSQNDDPVMQRWGWIVRLEVRRHFDRHALVSTLRDAVRLMIALELHQRAHGAYPDDLSALVPEFIDGLPTDTISDQPFGYRRLEEPDEFGRKYLLWSYGIDGEDNDGVEPPENAFGNAEGTIYPASVAAMLLPAMSGYDAVLNRTREQTIRAIEKERSQWPE